MLSKSKIKQITSLKLKKVRDTEGLFVAEGYKTIYELARAGFPVLFVVTVPELTPMFQNIGCEVIVATPDEMGKISMFSTPSQALAVCEKKVHQTPLSQGNNNLIMALDGIQDPGNLGTLIRLCSWFGIDHLVCSPDTADCYGPKAVQATMGALAHVSVSYSPLNIFLSEMELQRVPAFGTFLEGENIYTQDLPRNGVIVLGNEGHGIRSETAAFINRKLFIPPFGTSKERIESLNVSLAASIIISEFRRRTYGVP
jgi:TrmH family RNA methyltransferase